MWSALRRSASIRLYTAGLPKFTVWSRVPQYCQPNKVSANRIARMGPFLYGPSLNCDCQTRVIFFFRSERTSDIVIRQTCCLERTQRSVIPVLCGEAYSRQFIRTRVGSSRKTEGGRHTKDNKMPNFPLCVCNTVKGISYSSFVLLTAKLKIWTKITAF